MNKSLLIIIAITLICYCSYGQTSVAVYNNNNANYYQKMFTSKVVIHITSIDNWLPVDKTDDYTVVLKDNPDYQKTSIATDEMLLKIALENGDDYVCNLSIKTNLTINNIVASLVNIKTGLAEQKATATCSDLVSASSLDKAAQEIVDKLFLASQRKTEEDANTLAEQKGKEEGTKVEVGNQTKTEAGREEKAKAEAERFSPNVLIADGIKVYSNGKILLDKNEVRAMMVNTDAFSYYNKGMQRAKISNILFYSGGGLLVSGIVLTSLRTGSGHVYASAGIPLLLVGAGLGAYGVILRIKAGKDISQAVNMYNGRKSTSHVELDFRAMPNGLNLTVKF